MTYCPECNSADALILVTSILCVKKGCTNYDSTWADEQLTAELEEAYRRRDISKIAKKMKEFNSPW